MQNISKTQCILMGYSSKYCKGKLKVRIALIFKKERKLFFLGEQIIKTAKLYMQFLLSIKHGYIIYVFGKGLLLYVQSLLGVLMYNACLPVQESTNKKVFSDW
jgi:hypothetical protein